MVNQLKVFVQALHQQPFQSMTIVLNMDTLMPNKSSTASGSMDAKKFVSNVTAIIIWTAITNVSNYLLTVQLLISGETAPVVKKVTNLIVENVLKK